MIFALYGIISGIIAGLFFMLTSKIKAHQKTLDRAVYAESQVRSLQEMIVKSFKSRGKHEAIIEDIAHGVDDNRASELLSRQLSSPSISSPTSTKN